MSEHQYYEFRKIGGVLSDEAREEVSRLSSRVQVTSTSAAFTYHFGDFRGRPLELLAAHFDLLLYTANWGSRRLAFRFPRGSIDESALRRFAYRDAITVKRRDLHLRFAGSLFLCVHLLLRHEDFEDSRIQQP